MQSVYQQLVSANVNYGPNPPVALDLLLDVALALLEPIVDTVLISDCPAGADVALHLPSVPPALYVGATVAVGAGAAREAVVVKALLADGFTADCQHAHGAQAPVVGATFPSGQPLRPLFTQREMLDYLVDAQNDFLLKVRPVYASAAVDLQAGDRTCAQPDDTIRLERVARDLVELQTCTQTDLDCENPDWPGRFGMPRRWYQDEVGVATIAFDRLPTEVVTFEVWYSQRAAGQMEMLDMLLVPPVCAYLMKYGVLQRVWNKDGETRDPARAEYCRKRVELGVSLMQRFMDGMKVPEPQGRAVQSFKPMVMGQAPEGDQNAG